MVLGRFWVDTGCSPASRECIQNFPGAKNNKKTKLERDREGGLCGFFSFCVKPSAGYERGMSQWAHRCSTRNTTTSEESPPCMLPGGGGMASDVDGLFLGRQQSVHGSRHRLHVNLRAKTHFSGGTEALRAVWALLQG